MGTLGNNNYSTNTDNTNGKKNRDPNTYSAYTMSNLEGIDPSRLSVEYWGKLMKIIITPKLANPTTNQTFDHDNAAIAFLNHTKARILANEIKEVVSGKKHNGGVSLNDGALLSFSDGKEMGCGYCMILRKISASGEVMSTYVYEFNKEFHFGVANYNYQDGKFDKNYYDILEIEQLADCLEQYYLAMTNAIAHSVLNCGQYDYSRINTKINDICSNLGIDYSKAYNGGKGYEKSKSYFDKDGSKSASKTRTATIDELDGMMNPPDED